LIHGLDFDDTHLASIIHATAACLPTALTFGEELDVDGRVLLVAYAAGMETAIRVGAAAKGGFHHTGFHATGVVAHLRDEMVAIPAYDRNFLRTKMRPPSHWRIWIGRHAAVSHPLFSHNVLSFALEQEIQQIGLEASVPVNTQTSTILLGKHLLIYVMSSAVARNIIRRWVLPDLVRSHLAQIWPIVNATATWPPNGLALRDPVIHALAQHFFRAGNTLAKERVLRL
jgi:hypothetical protein